ncbi:unnamed protein product [Paramecium octaurelia]|uniref:WD-40 repeat protein n=1 Tax=Paramecium octaurelia TaxID=43137 RepID=A0A8S1UJK5_PAROT|nr:unnamed protein product [Paramecium octaurelia]
MRCTQHPLNQISQICIAPHKCKRKVCVQCTLVNEGELHQIMNLDEFRGLLLQKLLKDKYHQNSELIVGQQDLKILLTQTENMLKKIWEQLKESFNSIYNLIERQTNYYLTKVKENINLAAMSETDLDKLVKIYKGNEEKNSYLTKLEMIKKWWGNEIRTFNEKLKKELQDRFQTPSLQLEIWQEASYQRKENLCQILVSVMGIDEQIYVMIIGMLKKQKITNSLTFLSDSCNNTNQEQQKIKFITNVLNNIQELDFNKKHYSIKEYIDIRDEIIFNVSNEVKIINFFKFLVHLTAIDNQFIKCGSNSLHLLVEMKVDLREQNFENIKINDTSLIGANFAKCNLSGSQFNNVDISGMIINGAYLFNCKWNNLTIQEFQNKNENTSFIYSLSFSPDGATLASGSQDKFICLWDVKTGQQKAKLDGHTSYVNSVRISHNGSTLASGSDDKSICLWDFQTEKQIAQLFGHSYGVTTVCYSPDDNQLASGSVDNSIRFWDTRTGEQQAQLDGHIGYVYSVDFSPDGTTLASCSYDNSIRLWDLKTRRQQTILDVHGARLNSVCFSPDGSTLASGSDDNSIRLWDFKTGQLKAKLDSHTYGVTTACYSSDGTTLASSSYDNTISLWDVKTRKLKVILDAHTQSVNSVCFSPDGSTLASGSCDSSIRLWNVNGQNCNQVRSVCYSLDGKTVKMSGVDNSISLWDSLTGRLIDPSEKSYTDIIALFQNETQNNQFSQVSPFYTTQLIAQLLHLEATSALIFKGEFTDHQGNDLRNLFLERGGKFLESQIKFQSEY